MPRLGSRVVDQAGLDLIHDWISQLDKTQPAVTNKPSLSAQLNADHQSGRPLADTLDRLLTSTVDALRIARAIDQNQLQPSVQQQVIARAVQAEPHIRDLFERYLPEEQRTKRLGTSVAPEQILELDGDVARGRRVFFEQSGVQCRNCHRIEKQGQEVGPDLDQIGKKYDRRQILISILEPSKHIDAKYLQYHCETSDGQIHSGILVEKSDQTVVLRDAKAQTIRIPAEEVEFLAAQQKSLMPDLLLRDLTAQQVADLTAFLDSLE